MRPRWKKLFADLIGFPIRTILVVLSIAVGLYAIGMIVTIHMVVQDDMAQGYVKDHPPNIQISVDQADQNIIESVKKFEGIATVEGARKFTSRIIDKNGDLVKADILARKTYVEPEIMIVNRLDGELAIGEGEILIDQFKFGNVQLFEKDSIKVELPSGSIKELFVAGKIQDQVIGFDTGGGGFFIAPIQGYITLESLPLFEQQQSFNQIFITVEPELVDLKQIREVSDSVVDYLTKNDVRVIQTTVKKSTTHPNFIYVNAIAILLFVLGFMVVFLSSFLIINTLSAIMNQQIEQIGIMKSIGGTERQIYSIYIVLIFIFGFLALCLALPLSMISGFKMVAYLANKANFIFQGERFLWQPVLISIFIAFLIPQIVGAYPIRIGIKIKVTEALNGIFNAASRSTKKLLLKNRKISRPILLSIRNVFRNKTRLILSLITLSLGGSIFISTFNVQIALKNHTTKIGQYFLADVNLDFDRPYRISKVQNDLRSITGIKNVEGWAFASSQVILDNEQIGETVRLIGPPLDSELIQAVLIRGRWLQKGDHNAIVINEVFQTNFPDLDIGDTLKLRVNNEETIWTIVGFFQLAGKSTGFIAYTDFDSLAEYNNSKFHTVIFRIASNTENMNIDQQKELAREISTHLKKKGYHILQAEAGLSMIESTTIGLNIITIFLLVMALLTGIVGGIGLSGTMSINVFERIREIGIMRAIGASNPIIFRSVLLEGFFIGAISWLLSILLAIPMTKILCDSLSLALFDAVGLFAFTPRGVMIWLIVVILLSFISSILPAWNATKLTIREVLAYE